MFAKPIYHPADKVYYLFAYGAIIMRSSLALFVVLHMFITNNLNPVFSSLLIVVIMVFDYYDGVSFRRSHYNNIKSSRIQFRLLDSTADRFIIHVGSLGILLMDSTFINFYIPILLREIIISGYSISKYLQGYLLYPNTLAKIAALFVGLSIISFILFNSSFYTFLISGIMMVLSIFAFFEYKKRFTKFQTKIENIFERGEIIEVK